MHKKEHTLSVAVGLTVGPVADGFVGLSSGEACAGSDLLIAPALAPIPCSPAAGAGAGCVALAVIARRQNERPANTA